MQEIGKPKMYQIGTAFLKQPLNTPSQGLRWVTNPSVNVANEQKKPEANLW
jgi:hypothetical protein